MKTTIWLGLKKQTNKKNNSLDLDKFHAHIMVKVLPSVIFDSVSFDQILVLVSYAQNIKNTEKDTNLYLTAISLVYLITMLKIGRGKLIFILIFNAF